MDNEIRELLNEEIKKQIGDLSSLKVGSEEKSNAVDDVVKLYKLAIEDDKTKSEAENCKKEEIFKKNQLADTEKDRYVKIGIAAAEIILPLMFYAFWLKKGLKFEETGSFTSMTFKGLINRFRPTK